MIPRKTGTLDAVARGEYVERWRYNLQRIVAKASDISSEPIYVRIGEENNGGWIPWARPGKRTFFSEAVGQFTIVARSVSPLIKTCL